MGKKADYMRKDISTPIRVCGIDDLDRVPWEII